MKCEKMNKRDEMINSGKVMRLMRALKASGSARAAAVVAAAVAGGAMTAMADPYKVRVQLTEDEDGAMITLVNFDTKEKLDSTLVASKTAVFSGEIDEPLMARVVVDGSPVATFVLEGGSIVVDGVKHKTYGSMLNDQLAEYRAKAGEIAERFRATKDEAEREGIYNEYQTLSDATMKDNMDNPIGYYLFTDKAQEMDGAEIEGWIKEYPELGNYERVKKILASQARKNATSEGRPMADFEVTYNGETKRLSDYVGKGKYVLVDYWASWCGPCIRQIPVLKELLEEFGDRGLEVLGVAVWDEPENTLKAIESHGIAWPCIINAQTVPTEIYGINGIPCIILYGPDGTILSRDKQGEELKAAVREQMK